MLKFGITQEQDEYYLVNQTEYFSHPPSDHRLFSNPNMAEGTPYMHVEDCAESQSCGHNPGRPITRLQ